MPGIYSPQYSISILKIIITVIIIIIIIFGHTM